MMKKRIIAAIAGALMIGASYGATIEYNFGDTNGVVDVNTFGDLLVAGDYTLVSSGGTLFGPVLHPAEGTDIKARIGARKSTAVPMVPSALMSFTTIVPPGVTANLTELAFEQGFDASTFVVVDLTPLLKLTINVGGTDVFTGDYNNLPTRSGSTEGFWSSDEVIDLTGITELTGLTDTTVTFTFDFTYPDAGNSPTHVANTMDDVVLTGTATGTPTNPAEIQSFTVDSPEVFAGETVTLSWETLYEDTLTIDQGIGDVTGLTFSQVVVAADTTYELIAENTYGSDTSSVSVAVITAAPTINLFSASDTTVTNGSTVTLSWDVDNENSLSIDQGIGDVTGLTSTQVVVNADTTYMLTATSPNGSVNETVDIIIGEPPVTILGWENNDAVHSSDNWASVYAESGISSSVITHGTGLATGYTGGPGASAAMKYTGLASTNMSEAVANDSYLAFTVSASGADAFDIRMLQIADINFNKVSAAMIELRSSVDGFATTLASTPTTNRAEEGPHVWNVAGITGQTSVDFRLYFYWTDTSGTTTPDNEIGIHLRDDWTALSDFPEAAGTTLTDPLVVVNGIFPAVPDVAAPVADLMIFGPVSGSTGMVLSWTGEAGKPYGVETNSNLIISDWQSFMTGLVGDGGTITVTNTIGPEQVFYRIISEQPE